MAEAILVSTPPMAVDTSTSKIEILTWSVTATSTSGTFSTTIPLSRACGYVVFVDGTGLSDMMYNTSYASGTYYKYSNLKVYIGGSTTVHLSTATSDGRYGLTTQASLSADGTYITISCTFRAVNYDTLSGTLTVEEYFS